ncbi:aldo/keto reductase [Nibrella saemangeumensis]|uniref:Aldo/keto reductase n=1 Tax=Nibrella saemangeumensis TaxID=1084526 RepID=A0ABP8NK79_9BACT
MLKRVIPSSGEMLPVVRLGTWQTFNVGSAHHGELAQVLASLYQAGGRLIDSSPMYGKAEEVVGTLTAQLRREPDFFYATKVWTTGLQAGITQLDASFRKMKRDVMDLVQIHNLLDWQTHLPQLRKGKEAGTIRYIGLTHYQDSSHDALLRIMEREPVDFVQFNYSLFNRHAEERLLPRAAELGVATLINRPFGEGSFFRKLAGKPLPAWATEQGIASWAEFILTYIISHPAVTCVIPANGSAAHAVANAKAGSGFQPDEPIRRKMADFIQTL